ncbi:MAG: ATP-grasp domain-containing protein [Desulfosarcina sp.]|nr:ATP-grasp domain-containing protein [Desulfosarcina sp.]MBC2743124.1 ATP-grasp domain-containing protein [Desulfosarcina sp.]MBC2766034.1 ATP-grasp domain-containing protein [Desulfosarcina sp.]
MAEIRPITFLCIASYFKGAEFIRQCKRLGCRVILLTKEKLLDAEWPRDAIDEVHAMPDLFNREQVICGVSYLARTYIFDIIVALDDFDVETAATLREHLRLPGMGDTTARYFRDKLAMRMRARELGIRVPEFIHVLNHDKLKEFLHRVPAPWVLKPRSQASAIGIKKIETAEQLWQTVETLGDQQSFNLLEKFVPGDIYHVDSIVSEGKVRFAAMHKYKEPPMSVAHEGGIFASCTLERDASEEPILRSLNDKVITRFGLVQGVTHTEFIKGGDDGEFYFLETAARVGGAHIAELVETASGINLWAEWAKVAFAAKTKLYRLPEFREDYAGIVISLARQEIPDTTSYDDPEIVWRLDKRHHVGLIVRSDSSQRVNALIGSYTERFIKDFHASMPVPDRPID